MTKIRIKQKLEKAMEWLHVEMRPFVDRSPSRDEYYGFRHAGSHPPISLIVRRNAAERVPPEKIIEGQMLFHLIDSRRHAVDYYLRVSWDQVPMHTALDRERLNSLAKFVLNRCTRWRQWPT